MLSKLGQAALLATIQLVSAKKIKEFEQFKDNHAEIRKHKYAVISFYKGSEENNALDQMMDPVRLYIENAIGNGDWTDRDIGWFRANLEINLEDEPDYNSDER